MTKRNIQRNRIDFKDVNHSALANIEHVLSTILPNGKRTGGEWLALNPRRCDTTLGSFKINLRSGKWADFATGDRGGDLISLVAFILDVPQFHAARQLEKILGVRHG